MGRLLRIVALIGFTVGYFLLLEQSFRAIYSQTFYYTWCTITEPWTGWLQAAVLSGALLGLATLHLLLKLPTRGFFGIASSAVVLAMTLWVGLWASVTLVLSSDEPIVLSSPTLIPFLQGVVTVVTLRFGRRRRRQVITLCTGLVGLPALWIVANFLVATGVCGQ